MLFGFDFLVFTGKQRKKEKGTYQNQQVICCDNVL
jgi:hypothetical protein